MARYRSKQLDAALLVWAEIHNALRAAGYDPLWLMGDDYEEWFYAV